MANITQSAAIRAWFQASPNMVKDLNSKSKKYVVYTSVRTHDRYYIGKAGALRQGMTVAASAPVNEGVRKQIIEKGKKILESMG